MYIIKNVQIWTAALIIRHICTVIDEIRFICIQKGPNLVTHLNRSQKRISMCHHYRWTFLIYLSVIFICSIQPSYLYL